LILVSVFTSGQIAICSPFKLKKWLFKGNLGRIEKRMNLIIDWKGKTYLY